MGRGKGELQAASGTTSKHHWISELGFDVRSLLSPWQSHVNYTKAINPAKNNKFLKKGVLKGALVSAKWFGCLGSLMPTSPYQAGKALVHIQRQVFSFNL